MTRQAVSKHLAILEEANLVVTVWKRKRGGYFFTDPFGQLPPMKLSEGDLLAFFIAGQSLKLMGHSRSSSSRLVVANLPLRQ